MILLWSYYFLSIFDQMFIYTCKFLFTRDEFFFSNVTLHELRYRFNCLMLYTHAIYSAVADTLHSQHAGNSVGASAWVLLPSPTLTALPLMPATRACFCPRPRSSLCRS
jgi:hypothetical protein